MIERINFIEKKPYEITYRKIAYFVSAAFFIMTLFTSIQFVRLFFYQQSIKRVQTNMGLLESRRELLLKEAPPKVESGRYAELLNIFSNTPVWASLVEDTSKRLPPTVWLTEFHGIVRMDTETKAEAVDKKAKKRDTKKIMSPTTTRSLTLSGLAREFNDLANFLAELSLSPYLEGATLKAADKNNAGFTFQIQCGMLPRKR